jgi:hypothetical protein
MLSTEGAAVDVWVGSLVGVSVGGLNVGVKVSVGGTGVGEGVSVKISVGGAITAVAAGKSTGAAEGSEQAVSRKIRPRDVTRIFFIFTLILFVSLNLIWVRFI